MGNYKQNFSNPTMSYYGYYDYYGEVAEPEPEVAPEIVEEEVPEGEVEGFDFFEKFNLILYGGLIITDVYINRKIAKDDTLVSPNWAIAKHLALAGAITKTMT